jgi:hypothetical protein
MAENRLTREFNKREQAERPKSWQPASTLPEPDKQPGYVYRWVRLSAKGETDTKNIASKLKEGWEPVQLEEQPQYKLIADRNTRFEGGIQIGEVLLCKMPVEFRDQRAAYYARKNKEQMDSVDNNFLRENDSRMPVFAERKSTTSFGRGL